MNDKDTIDDDMPDWLWNIVERHDLGLRADFPRGGGMVLLVDARDLLKEITAATIREQWLTPSNRQRLHKTIDMLIDADRLFSVPK